MEFSYELKIPQSRVAVLIGPQGTMKRKIEKVTSTKLNVDSQEGDVFILSDDGLNIYTAREIVTAIARGYNPQVALLLAKPEYTFEQIDLSGSAKTKNHLIRLRGRLIGSDGKTRRLIEELTECYISVFGKTVCIIGTIEHVPIARKAVEKLIKGAQHSNVYRFLEKQRRSIKEKEMLGK